MNEKIKTLAGSVVMAGALFTAISTTAGPYLDYLDIQNEQDINPRITQEVCSDYVYNTPFPAGLPSSKIDAVSSQSAGSTSGLLDITNVFHT